MQSSIVLFVSLLLVSGISCPANEKAPVPISPGSDGGIAGVENRCPTFSWSEVAWAARYRIVVFVMDNGASAEEMMQTRNPALSQEVTAGGSSWTPGVSRALAPGLEYAWCVGAVDSGGNWIWSEMRRFRVVGNSGMSSGAETGSETGAGLGTIDAHGIPLAGESAGGMKRPGAEPEPLLGTEGSYSTFYGSYAGNSNSSDTNCNSFFGAYSGYATTGGTANSFLGYSAGSSNTSGHYNTFVGSWAGNSHNWGDSNTFIGASAGYSNSTGDSNTFFGHQAGYSNSTGKWNTYLGYGAGYSNSIGSYNLFLGYRAGCWETRSNRLYIANSDTTAPLIYGEFDNHLVRISGNLETTLSGVNNTLSVTRTDGASFKLSAMGSSGQLGTVSSHPVNLVTGNVKRLTVAVSGNVGIGVTQPAYPLHMASGAHCTTGGVWTNASSRSLKENIVALPLDEAATALQALNPVKYNYMADSTERCVGFIAEEVPELVAQNDRHGLSPMDIVAVLTRVVQEQQRLLSVQEKAIAELEKEIAGLKGAISAGFGGK